MGDHPADRQTALHAEVEAAQESAFPLRVFILLILALVCYSAIVFVPSYTIRSQFHPCLGTLILGIGFYLVYRGGSGAIAGVFGLAFLGLASALRNTLVPQADGTFSMDYFVLPLIVTGFLNPTLVSVLGIIGARRKHTRPCFGPFSILTALSMMVLEFCLHWNSGLLAQSSEIIVVVAALSFLFSFAFVFAAGLAKAFQETGAQRLSLSWIARVWCVFAAFGTVGALVHTLIMPPPTSLQSLLVVPATVGMFMLIFGIKGGFHLALIGVGFVLVQTLAMLVRGDGHPGPLIAAFLTAMVNLSITWLFIRRSLRKKPPEPAMPEKRIAPPPAANSGNATQRPQLMRAALAVFNNPFSPMIADFDDVLWKEPIQKELDALVQGGKESLDVLEELLMRCARGRGETISKSWWYGSKWAVKAVALLPRQVSPASLLVRVVRTDSNVYEWFTYAQTEAAKQLGRIGTANELPALEELLSKPLSMSPVTEIANAIAKIGGTVQETPAVILAKAQNQLGDADGIDYLLSFMNNAASWTPKEQGFMYYLLANKSGRLGYADASRAFFAAQIAACPDPASFGWQEFIKDGIQPSPENAMELRKRYPPPQTMEAIKTYSNS